MKVSIDADSIIYIAADRFQNENQFNKTSEMFVLAKVDSVIKRILKSTKATHYVGFYGSSTEKNFRYDIAKTLPYKGKRKAPLPYLKYWSTIIKKHMSKKWGFVDCGKLEADDAAVMMNADWISSPDKDLRQKEGKFFNYKASAADASFTITPEQAKWNFFSQWIIGDLGTDNIPGCPGAGPGKAKKVLDPNMTWLQMYRAVVNCYFDVMVFEPRRKALEATKEKFKKQAIKDWRANNKPPLKKEIKAKLVEEAYGLAEISHNITYQETYLPKEVYEYLIEQFHLIKMLRKPKYDFVKPEWIPVKKGKKEKEDDIVKLNMDMPKENRDIDILMDL